MYGDYECMRHGSIADCLVDLTGGMPERYMLRDLHLDDNERTRERLKAALADSLQTHSLVMLTCDNVSGGNGRAQVHWAKDVRSARRSTARTTAAGGAKEGVNLDEWPSVTRKNRVFGLSSSSPRADDKRSEEEVEEEDEDEDGEDEEETEEEGTASENASRNPSARSRGSTARITPRKKTRPKRKLVAAGPGALSSSGLTIGRGYIVEGYTQVSLSIGTGKKVAPITLLLLCNPWNDAAWNGPWSTEYRTVLYCSTHDLLQYCLREK